MAWRCPWCRQRGLHLHPLGTPWLHVPAGGAHDRRHSACIRCDVAWFSCANCGEDGTWGALVAKLRGYPDDAPKRRSPLAVRRGRGAIFPSEDGPHAF